MVRVLKDATVQGLRLTGANALMHWRQRDAVLVLTYHGVVPERTEDAALSYDAATRSVDEFERQLRALRRRFNPVGLRDVRDWVERGRALPPHPVLLTLDDGYRSSLVYAAPLLERYGIPAVVFLSTGYIGGQRILWPVEMVLLVMRWPHATIAHPAGGAESAVPSGPRLRYLLGKRIVETCKRLPAQRTEEYFQYLRTHSEVDPTLAEADGYAFMTWDDVRELQRRGIEFGAHTVEHPILSRVGPARLQYELSESKRQIERQLGIECFSMAYPNGGPADYNPAVLDAVREAGYSLAFTVANNFHRRSGHPLAFSRMSIPPETGESEFDARVCGSHRLVQRVVNRSWRLAAGS